MADRPWTAVATDKVLNENVTIVFSACYDMSDAAKSFKKEYKQYDLVALIPGEHQHIYVEGKKNRKRIPPDQLFSGF